MRAGLAAVGVLLVAVTAGCGGTNSRTGAAGTSAPGGTSASSSPSPSQTGGGSTARYTSYAALGDSYTSAPLVPITDANSICLRSDHNYPSLLAKTLAVKTFRDVSCSGAETKDFTGSQKGEKPQLDAVDAKTDLVTVSIGGNDVGAIAVVLYECPMLRSRDPQGSPCRTQTNGWIHNAIHTVETRVTTVLQKVKQRAPKARIIAIDYPQVVGTKSCSGLPLAAGDVAFAHEINHELDDAILAAASKAGVDSLDLWGPSAGHDVCSSEPWINGNKTEPGKALALHPFAVEQQAVASLLAKKLRSDS